MNERLSTRPALIIIDLQHGIVERAEPQQAQAAVDNSITLSKVFLEKQCPVFIVNVAGRPKGVTELQISSTAPASVTVWGELIAELSDNLDFHYITKYSWGAFTNTSLKAQLQQQGITDVYLTGIATSIGVESTARQAFELDYNVVIVEDAIADMNETCHRYACERIFPKMAQLKSFKNIIDELYE